MPVSLRRPLLCSAALLVASLAPPALAGAIPSSAAAVAPHSASYSLRLASVRSGATIGDVRGEMNFAWGDACDGWTVTQGYQMELFYAQGGELTLESAYATWESKDGEEFSFTLTSGANGFTDKDIRGNAQIDAAGGTAWYRRPEPSQAALPAGTMFPSWHTLRLIDEAQAGRSFFAAQLFDGTEIDDPLAEVTAVIGRPQAAPEAPLSDLLARPGWPVRMAFFKAGGDGSEPDYEIALTLLDNGIVSRMDIDYGDFVVRATLDRIEPLPASGC